LCPIFAKTAKRLLDQAKVGPDSEATIMQDLQLLTCDEVAQILRVSSETVRHLAAAGELPGRKIGRAWRFSRLAIEKHILGDLASSVVEAAAQTTGIEKSNHTQQPYTR
jgi:excisionase family DNA binding protein